MSTIEGVGGPGPLRTTRRSVPAQAGAGFSVPAAAADGSGAASASEAVASAGLDAMLSLQEFEPASERDRRARRHGQAMLAALAGLQTALLAGPDGGGPDGGGSCGVSAALDHLGGLLAGVPPAADPALAGVLSAVRLRVMVELARRDR